MAGFRSRKKTCSNFQFRKKQRLNSAMTLKTARKSQTSPEETPNSSRHWRIWRENRSIASEHLLSIYHQVLSLRIFRRWGTPWNTCNICRSPWAIWAKVVWRSVSSCMFGMDFEGNNTEVMFYRPERWKFPTSSWYQQSQHNVRIQLFHTFSNRDQIEILVA